MISNYIPMRSPNSFLAEIHHVYEDDIIRINFLILFCQKLTKNKYTKILLLEILLFLLDVTTITTRNFEK